MTRIAHIEEALTARGRAVEDASLEEIDTLWDEAKKAVVAAKAAAAPRDLRIG